MLAHANPDWRPCDIAGTRPGEKRNADTERAYGRMIRFIRTTRSPPNAGSGRSKKGAWAAESKPGQAYRVA